MFSGLQTWAYKNTYATSVSYRQEALTVHKPSQFIGTDLRQSMYNVALGTGVSPL